MTMIAIRPFRGLGLTHAAITSGLLQERPDIVGRLTHQAATGVPTDMLQAISDASAAAAAGGGGPPAAGDADKCGCLVQRALDAAAQAGQVVAPEMQDVFVAECTQDAVAFEQMLAEFDINTKGCAAWWKQPRNWAIGGAVVLAGGLLLWSRQ